MFLVGPRRIVLTAEQHNNALIRCRAAKTVVDFVRDGYPAETIRWGLAWSPVLREEYNNDYLAFMRRYWQLREPVDFLAFSDPVMSLVHSWNIQEYIYIKGVVAQPCWDSPSYVMVYVPENDLGYECGNRKTLEWLELLNVHAEFGIQREEVCK